ncbi:MAG TPA: dihydroorotase family protein, partial [Candidatus Limnocylindrales bacterium]
MALELIVRNGTVVTSAGRQAADVAVADGRIASIGAPGLAGDAAQVVDADGLLVLPGVIDAHVHLRQPGLEHEEDWQSGTRAAVMGGVTTVLEMPNTVPPTATVDAAQAKLALAEAAAHCDFGLFGLLADRPDQAAELAGSGLVIGLKAFLGPTTGELASPTDYELRRGLEATARSGLRVAFHAEDAALVAAASARLRASEIDDPAAHLRGRPAVAEVASIERVGRLLADIGARGHIAHLTSAEGLAAVERWRAAGVDLTAEVTPHHLLLGEDVYARFGGMAKVNPPIRGAPHAAALLAALADGRIDVLASDHAPHRESDKRLASIWAVPAGFAGVETLLPLLLSEVAAGRLTLERLV